MEKDITAFITSYKSVHTKETYKHSLSVYLDYCDSSNIDPRLATYENARDFVLYITNKGKSSVVIRQTITIVKSFYEYMLDIHELHVGNPFSHKSLLPRKERIKPLLILTMKEYERLVATYSKDTSKQAFLAALAVIVGYGVRISAFHNAKVIGKNRIRITEYKGSEQTLLLASVDLASLHNVNNHYKSTKSLEVALVNFLKGCYEKGITDNVYSPHDFRHLYACNLYNETKDIVKVSTALNHSNIAVTDTYITALKRNSPIKTKTKVALFLALTNTIEFLQSIGHTITRMLISLLILFIL